MVTYTSGKVSSFLSAACMLVVALLNILLAFEVVGKSMPSQYYQPGFRLDPDELVLVWRWRRSRFPMELAANFFGGVAFLLLVHSAACFGKLFPLKSAALKAMKNCFLLGSLLPALEFTENLGTLTTANQISQWGALDLTKDVYPALELAYLMTQSRAIWLFSLPFILIGTGVIIASYLSFTEKCSVPIRHAGLGIFTGLLGLVVFCLQVAAYSTQSHLLLRIFRMVILVWVVSLVGWVCYLGVILGREHTSYFQNQGREAMLVLDDHASAGLVLAAGEGREMTTISSSDH